MKKIFMVLLMALLVCFSINTTGYAEESFSINDLKEEYDNFLAEKIKSAEGQERKDLVMFSKLYSSLPIEEQYQFLEFFHAPDKVDELARLLLEPVGVSGKTIKISDSIDVVVKETTKANARADMGTNEEYRQADWIKEVSVFGFAVMQHTSTINYSRTRKGGVITGISGSDHRMTRNFTLNSASYTGKTHAPRSFPASYALSKANVSLSLFSKHLPYLTYVSGECQITVDASDNIDGYMNTGD